ncbi:MAG: hypothetical protein ACPG77_12730 [Nannocystaceae bacterium]
MLERLVVVGLGLLSAITRVELGGLGVAASCAGQLDRPQGEFDLSQG